MSASEKYVTLILLLLLWSIYGCTKDILITVYMREESMEHVLINDINERLPLFLGHLALNLS